MAKMQKETIKDYVRMRNMSVPNMLLKSIFVALLVAYASGVSIAYGNSGYTGADKCAPCHAEIYEQWKGSGHAKILHKSSDREVANIPLPAGYERRDILYIIGGFRWKALFIDRNGYIITSASSGKGQNQYNAETKKWSDYLSGQKVPYDCGECHTTGYLKQGHQNNARGVIGTWKFEGVQCEACHGPGSVHVRSTLKSDIRIDRKICLDCHETKPVDEIPVEGVFISPYSEGNQLRKSKMRNIACIDCHNPHESSEKSIKQTCESCHQKVDEVYKDSFLYRAGVKCTDCHMPPAVVVAEGDQKRFLGDLKSHIFKIEHTKELPVAEKNGRKINPGYLSVDYACMRCHSVYESREWAVRFGAIAHKIKISPNLKIMRLQMVFTFIGFIFSIAALLSSLSLKNWLLPSLDKKKMLSVHKHSAWITFAGYIFISILCLVFHMPFGNISKMLNLGWFLLHVINGPLGIVVYGGKIVTVRKQKKGWMQPGVYWGASIFIFWLIQFGTSVISFFSM